MLKRPDGKDIWIRKFEICEPKRHKKGFTVYKVVSTVFPRNFPDGATKITVWKRYKDFKALHKELDALFHQLYLKGKFPQLPKDKFFGRFDADVIEERRIAALGVLEFSATYPQLFMNKIFVNFFEDGHYPRDFNDDVGLGEEGNLNVRVEEEDLNFDDCLLPEKVWHDTEINPDEEGSSASFSCASPEPAITTISGNNCPPSDPVDSATSSVVITTGSNVAEISEQTSFPHNAHLLPNVVTFSDEAASHSNQSHNTSAALPSTYSLEESQQSLFKGSSASLNEDPDYLEEFDFCHNESQIPNSSSSLSLNTCGAIPKIQDLKKTSFKKYSSGFNLFDFLPIFTKKQDAATDEQVLSNSLSSYIREAAGFISVGKRHESNADYSSAFDAYTAGIQVLLEGAQGDQDNKRRTLVKGKVEKYLSHAEKLKQKLNEPLQVHNSSLAGATCSASRESHIEDSFVIVKSNVMPSSIDELKNYKIVGSTYNNMLVAVDITAHGGPDCFAIKVLRKSSFLLDLEKPTLIPNCIPFMVKLLKWFNTDDAIVLVLQYAAGGRLLNFVQSYQTKEFQTPDPSQETPNHSNLISDVETELYTINNKITKDGVSSMGIQSRNIGAGDFVNSAVGESPEIEQSRVDMHSLSFGQSDENVKKCNWELEPVVALNLVASTFNDVQPDALIQNSKELIKTVSKTLEAQKKSIVVSLDNSQVADASLSQENDSITKRETIIDRNSYCASGTFMVPNSQNQYNAITDLPSRTIPERLIKVWAAELVIALDKLHHQGITYGDLDIHNILLGDNGHILLSYRALWNEVDSKSEWNDFSAPEVVNALGKALWKTHPSADWWSLGAILYFLLTGSKMQDIHPEGLQYPQTVLCVPPINVLGEPLSTQAKTFLVELLHYTPSLRLGYYGVEEIKSHPFFAEFDWIAIESSTLFDDVKQ